MASRQQPEAAIDDAIDARWLTATQLPHWAALVAMIEVLGTALDTQLKRDAGINHFEYSIMACLSDAPDHTMGMSQLAAAASGSLSRLSHALGRLASKGWVARCATGVGRSVDVTMTNEGAEVMRRIAPGHIAEARRLVVDVLSSEQFAALGESCRAILDAVDPFHTAMIDSLVGEG